MKTAVRMFPEVVVRRPPSVVDEILMVKTYQLRPAGRRTSGLRHKPDVRSIMYLPTVAVAVGVAVVVFTCAHAPV